MESQTEWLKILIFNYLSVKPSVKCSKTRMSHFITDAPPPPPPLLSPSYVKNTNDPFFLSPLSSTPSPLFSSSPRVGMSSSLFFFFSLLIFF